jgi:hypothetical protein
MAIFRNDSYYPVLGGILPYWGVSRQKVNGTELGVLITKLF